MFPENVQPFGETKGHSYFPNILAVMKDSTLFTIINEDLYTPSLQLQPDIHHSPA